MNKQPKFFCENCNAEVRRDAVVCPHCGRFFASVRCPACGFTGTHKEFKDGCPSCAESKVDARIDADPLPLWIYGLVILLCAALAIIFFLL